ncbi:ABC transporter substrate-binding protein [Cohnella thailandensis]|uniref:ABC transporter substrate-binding protein n=1 Tax=Cohnella thailandensis TaxID=557557 RepID=A0A841SQC0_9BACL|nr:ABC transporter substrate-binding protein [Cohnella thailandensis]MBB6633392.1 ABC transporter substrate-binding protein [Cohnella thailandensis]MBP1977265.1 putative aldouronate transport system substrate-binding protein [Cohnella thailandensis]
MNASKKWLALLLIVCLSVLAACSSNNSSSGGSSASSPSAGSQPSSGESGEAYELNVAFPIFGAVPSNMPEVEKAISDIAKEKIGATVKLTPISIGAWSQQSNLMLTSNEKVDLIYVSGTSFTGMVSKGQLLALDDLLGEHGPDIVATFDPEFLKATAINGKTYAVPSNKEMAVDYGLSILKRYIDKYKIDPTSIKTLDDLDGLFKTIKDGESDLPAILVPQSAGISFLASHRWFDPLGDSIGVLPDFGGGLTVANLYESSEYAAFVKKMREWYQAGYIMKDSATNKDNGNALILAGKGIARLSNLKPGYERQTSLEYQEPATVISLTQAYATTSSVASVNWGIPYSAKNPEKSMRFLNLMYGDTEIINLFDWGIEGKDYVKKSENIIAYPEGVDATTVAYNLNLGWMFGNQLKSYIFEGEDPDLWKKMAEYNANAVRSPALGFSFDASPVKTEYAAVTNVINQYALPLETGSVDPDKILPEFIAKLKSSGIEKIIAEKQKQLDEWKRQNG